MATTLAQPHSSIAPAVTPERKFKTRKPVIVNALLGGIVCVATILRIRGITSRPFWFDETISVGVARLPWIHFLRALWSREACMALYYTALRAWLWIGSSEPFVRSLSVIFSVATIPVIYALGTRLINRKVGLLAAWFLAINAFHVNYAQEVRAYALVVFLGTAATLALARNIQEPSSARWGVYVLLCTLCIYSHLFGVLVVAAHVASLPLMGRERFDRVRRDLLTSYLYLSFCALPAAIFVVASGAGPVNWIGKTRAEMVFGFFVAFGGEGGKRLLALNGIAVLLAGFAWIAAWRTGNQSNRRWPIGLMWAWLVVPILVLLAASWIQPLFVWRYLSPSLPAFALLVAIGIDRARPATLGWILAAAISVAGIAGTVSGKSGEFVSQGDDWRQATSFIFNQARPGDDVFFFLNFGHIPFEYYRSIRHPMPEWPKPLEAFGDSTSLTYHDFQFEYLAESLAQSRPAGDRIWLVYMYDTEPDGTPNRASQISRTLFAKGRQLVEEKNFSGVRVLLYARP